MNEEMSEKINVEEEATEEPAEERRWTEEFTVVADELVDFVKRLIHETNIRRIIIKNESRRINFEVPLLMGVAGIALLPVYAALALIAALVADCTILVERVEKEPETAES
jgi:CHASE3 domain sensor protein